MTINYIALDEVDSTNNYLKLRHSGLPDGTLVTAERQTAGKGRRGHGWEDDRGMLPLSFLLKDPPYPDTVTLCAAAAVCAELEELLPGESFGIKWPNDIILRGHKLCGILCESVCFGSSIDIICGIGVNISQSAEFFQRAGIIYGGSLKMLTGAEPDREKLAYGIAGRLYDYSRRDFPEFYDEYARRCLTVGKTVRLIGNGTEREVFAEGISPKGYLICSDGNGRFEVNSGEVSVRGLLGYV